MRPVSFRASALACAAIAGLCASTHAEQIYGITGAAAGGSLVTFDSATPGAITNIGALSGVLQGHSVRAIDFRPLTGELYALSTNATNGFQLYTVNLATAALTPVGSGGTVSFTWPARVSMDFNPSVDRLRVVTGGAQNLRMNPITGALVAEDTALAYVAGDPNAGTNPPFPVGVAYDNNDNDPSTATTMYVWDFDNDALSRVGDIGGAPTSPNSGQMTTIFTPSAFITNDGGVGFDVSGVTGAAYFSYNNAVGGAETFATLNLTTGALTNIGVFGSGIDMLDISAVIPEPASIGLLGLAVLGLTGRRGRRA